MSKNGEIYNIKTCFLELDILAKGKAYVFLALVHRVALTAGFVAKIVLRLNL